ncbi:MAG: ATP-binding cassette domain-containing protein [Lachnospiraceae bacterium]|nr:ATP-binding cassette domain-containing protein [Lachnospiraceae bacterium]
MHKKLNKKLIFGICLASLMFVPVLIGFFVTPYDPEAMDISLKNAAPSLTHLFGTDNFGRDIFSRIMEGGKTTFLVALATVFVGAVAGTAIGAVTGYFGGIADEIFMRLNDALASLPSILLALVIVSVLNIGTANIVIALGIVFIPSFARIMRSEVIRERGMDYVRNARLCGAGHLRVILVHILPNTRNVFLSTALIGINNAILAEAGMSFLGLGVQPPEASLGRMLAESQAYLLTAPWYALFTGAFIVLSILSITLIGENLGVTSQTYKKVKRRINKQRIALLSKIVSSGKDDILVVDELSVSFCEPDGSLQPCLDRVSVKVSDGEIVGIVGESGAGKSMLAKAVMGIMPKAACMTGGTVSFLGEHRLDTMSEEELGKLRGSKVAMVFQEPMSSLNPLMTIGDQVKEVLDIHFPELDEKTKRERTIDALDECGLAGKAVFDLYPHELSGGMRQRAMIAMAVIARPELVIADEPTTALDAKTADHVLELLGELSKRHGISVLLISHDLEVIRRICSRVYILKDGRVVEQGDIEKVFETPGEEYTKNLIRASHGIVRCTYSEPEDSETVLEVRDLNVYYRQKSHGFFSRSMLFKAVNNVSMKVDRHDTVGLVGESGSGKTSLVRAIAGFIKQCDGEVIRDRAKSLGMVFQDPHSSLNPCKRVGWILEEPLKNTGVKKDERKRRVRAILESVELSEEYAMRHISELSGGQKQRVAIALSVICRHDLVILDEPVSALDVTIREQILELLVKLKEEMGHAYIFISHDMGLVKRICNKIYRVDKGDVTELKEMPGTEEEKNGTLQQG